MSGTNNFVAAEIIFSAGVFSFAGPHK